MIRFQTEFTNLIANFRHSITQLWVTKNQGTAVRNIYFGSIVVALFVILRKLGQFLPVGFDWHHFFDRGIYPQIWMPWTKPLVDLIDLPTVFALTVLAIGLRAYRNGKSPLALFFALLSLPTLWVLFLGNLDGLAALGLLLLPWGLPLVLIKPQVASFALLAEKRTVFLAAFWLGLSLIIWGLWPLNLSVVLTNEWKAEWQQDITLFPFGLLLALPLLWFSRGDEDLLMAAGSLGTPHLFPYHFIVLMPALARMKLFWMVLTWLVSWTPLLSNWLGERAWHFGNLMSVCFWLGIYLNRKKNKTRT